MSLVRPSDSKARWPLSMLLAAAGLLLSLFSPITTAEPISFGERFTLNSKILGENHSYSVYLPPHYNAKHHYPVIYLLDGEMHARKLLGTVDSLSAGVWPRMPQAIIVGIDNSHRMRDYTPVHTLTLPGGGKGNPAYAQTGGTSRFLDYIEQELQPVIEARYSTRRPNILIGHSFGGLVTLEALREQRKGFNAYVAIDPSLWFDYPHYVDTLRQQLGNTGHDHGSLFIAAANNPFTPGMGVSHLHRDLILDLAKTLKTRESKTFHSSSKFYADADHALVVGPAIFDGMRWLFKGYHIPYGHEAFNSADVIAAYTQLSQRLQTEVKPDRALLRHQWGYLQLRMKDEAGEQTYRQLLEYYYPNQPVTPSRLHGDPHAPKHHS